MKKYLKFFFPAALAVTLPLVLVVALTNCQSPPKESEEIAINIVKPHAEIQIQPKLLDRKKEIQKIQFASCAHQKQPQPIWTIMLEEQPDLYIGTGDNVYASSPADKPISEAYLLQSKVPEFAVYRNLIPMIATWDDHDFGVNDGGKENAEKDEAKSEFLKFWPNDREQIKKKQAGVYHSFILGPKGKRVQIILLDQRYFRDSLEKDTAHPIYPPGPYVPTQNKEKTILGKTQWNWLSAELKKKANLRLIVSSYQFLANEHGFEKWGNFPHEFKRMMKLFKSNKLKNVVILSGDRHHSEISHMKEKGLEIYDITSSGINRSSTLENEKNQFRLGEIVKENNFGQINIDWKKKELQVSIIDLDRRRRANAKIKF